MTDGPSMLPNIPQKSVILVDRYFYKFYGLKEGDIIVATSPVKKDLEICKRVVQLENREFNAELPIGIANFKHKEKIKIPNNHIWVEGDNKNESFDCRHHGPLPSSLIRGKVLLSVYPFKSYT